MKQVSSFAPGKIIISGEHSVVFGQQALVRSIDKGIEVTFAEGQIPLHCQHDRYLQYIFNIWQAEGYPFSNNFYIDIHSTLPQKSGFGSSASFASAIFQNLAKWFEIELSKEKLFNLVWLAEQAMHHNSSGLDPMAVVYQGFISYQKNMSHQQINNKNQLNFVLINSGQASESTGQMVSLVQNNYPNNKNLIDQIGQITKTIINKIEQNQPFSDLIALNQKLLEKLGIVGHKAKTMISEIEHIGGVAKISGAGGIATGSGIILACHQDINQLINLANKNNWQNLQISI